MSSRLYPVDFARIFFHHEASLDLVSFMPEISGAVVLFGDIGSGPGFTTGRVGVLFLCVGLKSDA